MWLQMLFPDVDALNLVQVMEVMVGLGWGRGW